MADSGERLQRKPQPHPGAPDAVRQPLGRNIITSLWGNCTIKAMVGFLFLYPAFVAKSHDASGWEQLQILGLIGAAAAIGNFAGNFTAAILIANICQKKAMVATSCPMFLRALAINCRPLEATAY